MTTSTSDLTQEEVAMFMDIVEASLRVAGSAFLAARQFQYLFPHEVMICGIMRFRR